MSKVAVPEHARVRGIRKFSLTRGRLPNLIEKGWPHSFLFAVFSLAYILLAPNIFQQDWDSLMYSYGAEVRGVRSIWGNHPLSHIVLNSLYVVIRELGYAGKALPFFIICNSFISGAAVAAFFSLMKAIRMDYWSSVGYTMIFGTSYGLLRYSGSADVYSLSLLLLILAWTFLIHQVLNCQDRNLYISGIFVALSILSHQLNGVFLLVAPIIIMSQENDRWTRFVTFFAMAIVIVSVGLVVFGYIATSSLSVPTLYDWIRGYLGDPIYGTDINIDRIRVASQTALKTFLAPTYGRARFIRMAIYSFLIGAVSLGITQARLLSRPKKIVLLAASIQCLVSWLLISWFEPWYPKFWLLILIPGMILIGCCLCGLAKRLELWSPLLIRYRKSYPLMLFVLALTIAVFNMRYAVIREHQADHISQQVLEIWLRHSDENDMLITAGDLIPQLHFWAGRPNTIHLYDALVVNKNSEHRFGFLRDQVDRVLCNGNAVLFAPAIVDNFSETFLIWLDLPRNDLRAFFDEYQRQKDFVYLNLLNGEETQVYQLVNPRACFNND